MPLDLTLLVTRWNSATFEAGLLLQYNGVEGSGMADASLSPSINPEEILAKYDLASGDPAAVEAFAADFWDTLDLNQDDVSGVLECLKTDAASAGIPQVTLRLRISESLLATGDASLPALPWECLEITFSRKCNLEVVLVRQLARRTFKFKRTYTLRLFVAVADPANRADLSSPTLDSLPSIDTRPLDRVLDKITKAEVRQVGGAAPNRSPCTLENIKQGLVDFGSDEGMISALVLVCHGCKQGTQFWIQDANGQGTICQVEDMITMFRQIDGACPPLVILASCESGFPEPSRALAYRLVKETTVAAVLAMTNVVNQDHCFTLVGEFLSNLAGTTNGGNVEIAMRKARSAVPEISQSCVLLTRLTPTILWTGPIPDPPARDLNADAIATLRSQLSALDPAARPIAIIGPAAAFPFVEDPRISSKRLAEKYHFPFNGSGRCEFAALTDFMRMTRGIPRHHPYKAIPNEVAECNGAKAGEIALALLRARADMNAGIKLDRIPPYISLAKSRLRFFVSLNRDLGLYLALKMCAPQGSRVKLLVMDSAAVSQGPLRALEAAVKDRGRNKDDLYIIWHPFGAFSLADYNMPDKPPSEITGIWSGFQNDILGNELAPLISLPDPIISRAGLLDWLLLQEPEAPNLNNRESGINIGQDLWQKDMAILGFPLESLDLELFLHFISRIKPLDCSWSQNIVADEKNSVTLHVDIGQEVLIDDTKTTRDEAFRFLKSRLRDLLDVKNVDYFSDGLEKFLSSLNA